MALTYGTAQTVDQGATGTSPIVITKPTGTVSGSLLLAAFQHTATATIATPSGWTLIQRTISATGPGLTTFYRRCDGSEGANFSFSAGSNDIWEGCVVRYEGANATPFDVNSTNSNSSGTTLTASAVTTTADDETVTCVYITWNSTTLTNGASQTERLNFGSNGNLVLVSDFTTVTAGTSGAKTATQSTSDHWCAQQIAWKNAAGSGPSVPTVVAAGTAAYTASNNASITPGLPTGWANDDIGVLWYSKSNNDDLTTPSGWTEILTASQNNTTAQRVEVFVRRLQTGDSAPVLAGTTNTIVRGARIIAIRGVPTSGTAASWVTASRSNNAASATVTAATITPPDANSRLLMLEAYEDDPTARTTPTNWAAPVISTSALGTGMALAYSHRTWAAASSATGAVTWTVSGGTFANSVNVGILLALSPGGPQTVTLTTGIATAEAFGGATVANAAPVQTLEPTGIATAEAFGTPQVNMRLAPTGIATAAAFGASTVARGPVTVVPTGIATAAAFGSDRINLGLALTGIPTAAAFGTLRTIRFVTPAGIATGYAAGSPTLVRGAVTITGTGIASLQAFGTPGLSSGVSFLVPTGIGSASAFGALTVTRGVVTLAPTGIATLAAMGAAAVANRKILSLTGIPTAVAFGTTFIGTGGSLIAPNGIASLMAFGTLALAKGGIAITLVGIPSAIAFGSTVLTQFSGGKVIAPSGISGLATFGSPTMVPGTITVRPSGIGSAEAFGAITVFRVTAITIGPTGIPSLLAFGLVTVRGLTTFPVTAMLVFAPGTTATVTILVGPTAALSFKPAATSTLVLAEMPAAALTIR